MALKLNEAYPGRFNNPSPEYPQGSFKNRTTPTAEDGSYFEQQWANDHLAFLSSLLDGAGVEANGSVDQVGSSQYYNALLQVINDQVAVPEYLITSGIAGSFSNLKASATGLSALVTVTAGAICLKSASNEQVVLNSVAVTPSLGVLGANGLDAGVSAANTWYSLWVIWNGTTAAGLLSLSATAPTLPDGYTHKARVGWVRSDSTANKYPLSFIQAGRRVNYKPAVGSNLTEYPIMASGSAGTLTSSTFTPVPVAIANFAPPTCGTITVAASNFTAANYAAVAPSNTFNGWDTLTPPPIFSNPDAGNFTNEIFPEGPNIFWASTGANGRLRIFAWEDNL